ncbi:MAG: ATP-binding protein, partial [Gemmatirosa sp.]
RFLSACEHTCDVRRAEQWMSVVDHFVVWSHSLLVSTTCRLHYGGILIAIGRWAEAEEELIAAIRMSETSYRAMRVFPLVRLAELRVRQGRLEEAQRLIKGNEWHPTARRSLAVIALARGDVALAEDLAQRAAMALDNARLFAMAREARRRAEDAAARTDRLQRLTAALAGAATEHDAGELVMRHGVLPTGAYAGVIAERTADGDAIELLTCVGYPPEACMQVGRRWPADAPLPLAEAVRTGAPVFVASPEAWAERYAGGHAPAQAPAGAAPGSASRAWAALPLAGDAGVHGAILWTFAAPRDFDAEERALMAAVAQQCAQALERARLREAERRARAEAEEANRAKSEFLARMSHDLRTPLNAIGGYAQLIELGVHGPVTDAQTHAIGRIRRAQEHLLTLINDILSFAKLEAGQVVVTLEPVSVRALVDELASLVRPEAARRGLALGVDAGPDGLLVRADGGRLMQVLLNLTSNALKFTDAGTVGLGVAAGDDWVELHVSDSGRGIPRDRLAAIFDPFVQARGAADEQKGGVGLGLAIGRELARLMGGDLVVASDEGRGSTFTVRLPRS